MYSYNTMKQITIGRSPGNDVVINDPSVSRQHATLLQTEQEIIVSDNGSSNGTFINGNRIKGEATLQKNDILKFGTVLFPWKNHFNIEKKPVETKPNTLTEPSQPASVQHPPTPTSNANHQPSAYTPPPRKKNKGILIGLVALGFIVLVVVVLNLFKSNSSSEYAEPKVLSTDYSFVERGLMDKTLMGYARVENKSNYAGYVEVIGTCEQEGESFKKIEKVYLYPGEIATVEFEFREVKRLKYEPRFSAVANAVVN